MEKLKDIFVKMNEEGIPFPLVRDNKTNEGSFSATLIVISAFFVMASLIRPDKIDFWHALSWNAVSMGFYTARKFQVSKDKIEFESDEQEK